MEARLALGRAPADAADAVEVFVPRLSRLAAAYGFTAKEAKAR